jgi:hypothetical protein
VAPAATSSRSNVDAVTIGGLGVATALAAGSVFFGVKAIGTASDFESRKAELGVSREEIDSLQNDTRMQAGISVSTTRSPGTTASCISIPSHWRAS